jgi:hypothetical protein
MILHYVRCDAMHQHKVSGPRKRLEVAPVKNNYVICVGIKLKEPYLISRHLSALLPMVLQTWH